MARRKKVSEIMDSDTTCYYCNKKVPDNAMRCPHCGKLYSVAKKMITFAVVVILISAGLGYTMYSYFYADEHEGGDDDNGGPPVTGDYYVIKIELEMQNAPITAQNFVDLANQGKYTNVPIHRVINNFMIQGGDFTNFDGTGGHAAEFHDGLGADPADETTWRIPDEFHQDLLHSYGAVSMANSGPNTGGSQFFIVQNPNPSPDGLWPDGTHHLDGAHAVFGYVTSGMGIVDDIAAPGTNDNSVPPSPVIIKSITISESDGKTIATITVDFDY